MALKPAECSYLYPYTIATGPSRSGKNFNPTFVMVENWNFFQQNIFKKCFTSFFKKIFLMCFSCLFELY